MRLLDTTTKELKTFYGKKIPEYAILSHMWGREEEEVLFKHITGSDADKSEGKERKGYAKVDGACRQAIEDGWKYIWIDTCCIDKASSAELSEAINSMYEWYRRSEVCYVYLEDVRSEFDSDGGGERNSAKENDSNEVLGIDEDENDENDEDEEPGEFPIVPFERSRWFKRGWTLQELIAPQFVVFYSKGWIDIGTKASLRDTISAVTRIRVELLMVYDPEKASVAEKMSWAAFRKTTRAEDIAYCLMGLLGVNMPLLYGEDDRAFMRLQEELMKVSDDDSLFAWKSRVNRYKNVQDSAHGMLANSPFDFRDGTNIVQSKDGAYSPYSMTNKGLKIKLPLLPINLNFKDHIVDIDPESVFKTILKCTVRDRTQTWWIVIYLRKIREGYYERIFSHWLDETETPLSETVLTSLLVPQINTFTTRSDHRGFREIVIEILPTESGFTADGRSLVQGYYYGHYMHEAMSFKRQNESFGIAVGMDGHLPWLGFIDDVNEIQSVPFYSFWKGPSQDHFEKQHLDRLSKKIPGEDWWVTVSVKRTGHRPECSFLAVIDIQREPTRAKEWYIPPAISTSDTFFGNFSLKYRNLHSGLKKEAHDWTAMYNSKVERRFEVSPVYTLPSESYVRCVQFSCDGKYLATGDSDYRVQVYDTETGAKIYTFIDESNKSDGYICSICFSRDSKFIAAGDSKGCIIIWDIDVKCVHKVLNNHQESIESLCFSQILPSSHLLISGSERRIVRIWEIASGTSSVLTMLPDSNYSVPAGLSIASSPNGSLVAAGGSSGIIQIWDLATTQLLEELREPGNCVHIAFTPDGRGLVSGSNDEVRLKYWDVSGLVNTAVMRKFDDSLGDSGHSSALAEGDVGKIIRPIMTVKRHKDYIKSVAVSHDGRWFISASTRSQNCRLVFWDSNDATPQLILETIYLAGDSFLATSPVGNMFATTNKFDKMVRVWRYDNIEPQDNPSSHV